MKIGANSYQYLSKFLSKLEKILINFSSGRVAAQMKAAGQSTAHLPKISALSVTR